MKYLPVLPLLTRYPFLKISAGFLKNELGSIEKGFDIFPEAVEEGKEIVISAIKGKKLSRDFEEGDIGCVDCEDRNCTECDEIGSYDSCDLCLRCFENCKMQSYRDTYEKLSLRAKKAILAYLSSRIIVSLVDDWVRMRYAVGEADYYANLLKNEKNASLRLVARDLGLIFKDWNVHVSSYVKASSRIKADNWRLVNRRLRNGYVETSRTEMIRVMEEFLRERLSSKLKADQFEKYLEKEIKDVMKVISKERKFEIDLGEVKAECFPPCMKEILAELQRGMNIPHTARFALTSFLVNIGMEVDEIIDLFATAPDFDEDKTRYQVEHIAGERGKGVEYSCPNCSTMKTYQNCVKDCRVFHPIEYYKRCKGREKRFKARMVAGEQ